MDNDSVPENVLDYPIAVVGLEITPVCPIEVQMVIVDIRYVSASQEGTNRSIPTQVAVDTLDEEIV